VILLGATTTAQLDSNLRATDLRLSAADLVVLDALRMPPEEYWTHRATLPWN
jgi:aryl-alcohol dehydrogenase-like predicted oxidoreductase